MKNLCMMQWFWDLRYRILRSNVYRFLRERLRKRDLYDDFVGVLVTDRGTWTEICVTDIEVDMAGAKEQLMAIDCGLCDE